MAERKFTQCEGCGLVVENSSQTRGWIHLDGSLTRAKGVYDRSWQVDYIQNADCCSIECLLRLLDGKAPKPLPLLFAPVGKAGEKGHDTAWDHLLDDNSTGGADDSPSGTAEPGHDADAS